ncbi:DUF305 domain-containing protein [Streptomyces sp. NRRL F-5065]|uniref:DUF305 domain-containing protein n=1 Tax=Streptomyces sp. NRRL F-5065 TaxID=1463855 RepID=UPI0004C0B5CF|nr:DUF305 domain-containing protein [Streptomyces sp. NRRL F-5065]
MSSIRTLTRRTALAAAGVTVALVLAACGGEDEGRSGQEGPQTSPSASAEAGTDVHNGRDVAFAQGMIPHHRQALDMARMVAGRSASAEVEDLAARIEKAQDPEITTMTGWLESWGEEVPAETSGAGHAGHEGMPGMMDDREMTELEGASGADFDRMFLTMMIAHHEGAVEMAETELAEGRHGPSRAMAEDVVSAQSAEIAEMRKLLGEG